MPYCTACAHNNPDTATFCAACGAQLPAMGGGAGPMPQQYPPGYGGQPYGQPYGQPGPYYQGVQHRTSGMAIAGFVLSFFCGILGLIFSILGYNESKNSGGTVGGAGLAMAGIIISIVSMVLGLLISVAGN
jgi:hypothetical protein